MGRVEYHWVRSPAPLAAVRHQEVVAMPDSQKTLIEPRPMDGVMETAGDLVQRIQRDLCLSESDLATALNVSPRTVERWRTEGVVPPQETRQRLRQLAELGDHLRDTFEADAIPRWLQSENRYLGGLTPLETLRSGRPDRVEAALEVIDSGIFL